MKKIRLHLHLHSRSLTQYSRKKRQSPSVSNSFRRTIIEKAPCSIDFTFAFAGNWLVTVRARGVTFEPPTSEILEMSIHNRGTIDVDFSEYDGSLALVKELLSSSADTDTSKSTPTILNHLRTLVFSESDLMTRLHSNAEVVESIALLLKELSSRLDDVTVQQLVGITNFANSFGDAVSYIDAFEQNQQVLQVSRVEHGNLLLKLDSFDKSNSECDELVEAAQESLEAVDFQIGELETMIRDMQIQLTSLQNIRFSLNEKFSRRVQDKRDILKEMKDAYDRRFEISGKISELVKNQKVINGNIEEVKATLENIRF